MSEKINKTLCYIEDDKLFLSNEVNIKHVGFFKETFSDFSTIVYFEKERPECPHCEHEMTDNGSRPAKPNKLENFRKKQYICRDCNKTKVTSLEPFIEENCNYSWEICLKCLNYDYINYSSYERKTEMIEFENGVKMPRQTAYHFESKHSSEFLKQEEEAIVRLLEENGIDPTGYYHYDEQYPHYDGKPMVRLALLDAITNLPINELIIAKEDFDKSVVKSFLNSSLSGLPKIALITDGAPMYPKIIDEMGMKHQLCVFHIIKNHHTNSFKNISRVSRRIKTIQKQIATNKNIIKKLKQDKKDQDLSQKKRKKLGNRITKIEEENKKLRKELKEKKDKLKELLANDERIENIYKAEDKKGATRKFNTLNNRRKHLDNNTGGFLANLDKKLDRTLTYYDDPSIPKTNNNIERYFGITLPHEIKRKYRTVKGLTRWLRLQRIRWIRRNILHQNELENMSIKQLS